MLETLEEQQGGQWGWSRVNKGVWGDEVRELGPAEFRS